MKKTLTILMVLLCSLMLSSCDWFVVKIYGILESEDPKIRVYALSTSYADGFKGELVNEDGSITEITFMVCHGEFCIYKYNPDGMFMEDIIIQGAVRPIGNKIILKCSDGRRIILEKVGEIPEDYQP